MSSANISLKIYPSGFLGNPYVTQTKPIDLQTTAKMLMNKSAIREVNPHTASVDVIELWTTQLSSTQEHKTFEFKESVIIQALQIFGTEKLIDWINANVIRNEEFSDYHYQWIDETLGYVYGDVPRKMSFNNWLTILSSGINKYNGPTRSNAVKSYIFGESFLSTQIVNNLSFNRQNETIQNFILNWVRQPNGINDLLASLNVLFGKR